MPRSRIRFDGSASPSRRRRRSTEDEEAEEEEEEEEVNETELVSAPTSASPGSRRTPAPVYRTPAAPSLQCTGLPVYRQDQQGRFNRVTTPSARSVHGSASAAGLTDAPESSSRAGGSSSGMSGGGALASGDSSDVYHLPPSPELQLASAILTLIVAPLRFSPGLLAGAAIFEAALYSCIPDNVRVLAAPLLVPPPPPHCAATATTHPALLWPRPRYRWVGSRSRRSSSTLARL